jgi:hypothetical protein
MEKVAEREVDGETEVHANYLQQCYLAHHKSLIKPRPLRWEAAD